MEPAHSLLSPKHTSSGSVCTDVFKCAVFLSLGPDLKPSSSVTAEGALLLGEMSASSPSSQRAALRSDPYSLFGNNKQWLLCGRGRSLGQ